MTTILLVEDNHLNREMFSRRLERKGFRVLSAADGREAVNMAQTEAPDLILMDLSLPIIDGWEATRKIKGNPATRAIPVIAMTAHAMVGDRDKALQAGCDDYETKPVDLPRLLGKIQTLLGQAGQNTAPVAPSRRSAPAPSAPAPIIRKTISAAEVPLRPQPASAVEQPHVLVVDDNQLNRDMLSRRLDREGYRVTLACGGSEAIASLDQHSIDLILLDWMMPEMNGLEALTILRASYSLLDLPIIIVTAKDQSEDMVQALSNGANDYVTKPFNFGVLLARMQTQLQLKRTRPALDAVRVAPRPSAVGASARPELAFSSARPAYAVPEAHPASTMLLDGPTDSGNRPGSSQSGDRLFGRGPGPSERAYDGRPSGGNNVPTEVATVAGYEILQELGRGGMGVVYKARHRRMNRQVALKVINKEHLFSSNSIQRFYREIQAAAQLAHPNIVMAFDAGEFGDTHYFAMEYIEGVDLSRLVKEHGQLPLGHACAFIIQAAKGLQHASERGLVHRDIKPSNLLVTWNGPQVAGKADLGRSTLPPVERATVKILDLGLALLYEPTDASEAGGGITRDGRVVGTADYMAPEQWMNAHKVDIRADLYALGGTFYYLLTGQVPFPSAEPMEKMLKHHLDEPIPVERLRAGLPSLVVSTVRRLMAKKPEQRFQQPHEVAEALKPILLG